MAYTVEEVRGWLGRDAVDAEGQLAGSVGHAYRDARTGGVTWLAVVPGDGDGVVPVPLRGCEPTGTAIRLPVLVAAVRTAARLDESEPLTPQMEDSLVAHFGLRDRGIDEGSEPQPPPDVDGAPRDEIVARLREAYALEGEGILRLETLQTILEDPEVNHDAVLHADTTQLHRTGVEERLKLLEKTPSHVRDLRHGALAMAAGAKGRLSGDPVKVLRDAIAFEEREAAFYAELEALARAAGDTATADLAASHRADEEAMAVRLAGSITRIDSPV